MRIGYKSQDVPAGLLAGAITAAAVLTAHTLVIKVAISKMEGEAVAKAKAEEASAPHARDMLVGHYARELAEQDGKDPDLLRDRAMVRYEHKAKEKLSKMSDQEVLAAAAEIRAREKAESGGEGKDESAASSSALGWDASASLITVLMIFRLGLYGTLFLGASVVTAYRLGSVD
jgi:hypothetical protein